MATEHQLNEWIMRLVAESRVGITIEPVSGTTMIGYCMNTGAKSELHLVVVSDQIMYSTRYNDLELLFDDWDEVTYENFIAELKVVFTKCLYGRSFMNPQWVDFFDIKVSDHV